jgi:hypothetical protein
MEEGRAHVYLHIAWPDPLGRDPPVSSEAGRYEGEQQNEIAGCDRQPAEQYDAPLMVFTRYNALPA